MFPLYLIIRPDGTGYLVASPEDRLPNLMAMEACSGSTAYLLGRSHPMLPPGFIAELAGISSAVALNAKLAATSSSPDSPGDSS